MILPGIPALIFASMANSAANMGNMMDAKSKGKVSLGLSITGIILSVLCAGVGLALYFTVLAKTNDAVSAWTDVINWAVEQGDAFSD